MNALHRKLLRDLLQARFLLLAITSMIAVGITTFVSLRSSYHNLDEARRRYYRQCRMADFWIDVNKMPLAELPQLASLPGITEVAGRIRSLANAQLPGVEKPLNVLVISLPTKPAGVLNGAVLKRGQFLVDNVQMKSWSITRLHRRANYIQAMPFNWCSTSVCKQS